MLGRAGWAAPAECGQHTYHVMIASIAQAFVFRQRGHIFDTKKWILPRDDLDVTKQHLVIKKKVTRILATLYGTSVLVLLHRKTNHRRIFGTALKTQRETQKEHFYNTRYISGMCELEWKTGDINKEREGGVGERGRKDRERVGRDRKRGENDSKNKMVLERRRERKRYIILRPPTHERVREWTT